MSVLNVSISIVSDACPSLLVFNVLLPVSATSAESAASTTSFLNNEEEDVDARTLACAFSFFNGDEEE